MTRLADDSTLTETLRLAVPLRIANLLAIPQHDRADAARRWHLDAGRIVGERGDLLQFVDQQHRTDSKRLRVAGTFEALARGLAALVALTPGGIEVAGLHWCLDRDCIRCRPPRTEPTMTRAEINAELERLDAEYRQLAGLPPYQLPTVIEPEQAPVTAVRRPRTVIDVHLPEVA